MKFELTKRRPGIGIIRVGFHKPGTAQIGRAIEGASSVTLRAETVSIIVEKISKIETGFSGRVVGFENWNEYEFEGLKPGDTIEFNEENVISCGFA